MAVFCGVCVWTGSSSCGIASLLTSGDRVLAAPGLNHFLLLSLFVAAPRDRKEETGQREIAPERRAERDL